MRIVFVMTQLGRGGAQRVSAVLADYLKEKGYDVGILCYEKNAKYTLKCNIPVDYLPDSGNVFLKHLKRIFIFLNYCHKYRVGLVIALFRGYDYTWLYRKLGKGRLLLSQRNDPKAEYDHCLLPRLESRIFYSGADAVVFQTEEERAYFKAAIQEKGKVIPNPVMEGLPEPWRGERERIIVNFCRLAPQKNLWLLLDAFKIVADKEKDCQLRIYGDGPLRDSLQRGIEERGLFGRVRIFPFSAHIHQEIRKSMMFVSSSDYEGISNSMLEAMAMGLPCICTDCPAGGARMVIDHGKNGLLTPVGDRDALADAMLFLLRNPDCALQLGRKAELVREEYAAEKICREWESLIHILIKNGEIK